MIVLQSWEFQTDFEFGWESGEIGASLAMGKGYSWLKEREHHQNKANEPTSWEAPIYPLIIAGVFKVFGIYSNTSAVVLIIFQIILSAGNCVLIYQIGRRIFNEWAGLLAALLLIMYPAEIHFAIQKVYLTIFYLFLLLLFIFQLLELAENPSFKKSILTGVTCGIAILCAPFIISFLPFALGWLFFKVQGDFKFRTIPVILVFVTICVIILPWQIRNYMIFDRFIPIRSNLGRELLLGNYGKEKLKYPESNKFRTMNEGKRSAIYEKRFKESLEKDPGLFFRNVYDRARLFWTAMPRKEGPYAPKTGKLSEQILGIYFLFILLLGIVGLCITRLKNDGAQLLFLSFLTLPIPFYLTWFSRFRYRFPVEVILIIFSSHAMYYFWKMIKAKWSEAYSNY